MSEESAKAFLKKVGEDKALGEQLKGADSEEKFLAVAKGAGFDFTKEEWVKVASSPEGSGALSESDLANAAGGWKGAMATQVSLASGPDAVCVDSSVAAGC